MEGGTGILTARSAAGSTTKGNQYTHGTQETVLWFPNCPLGSAWLDMRHRR